MDTDKPRPDSKLKTLPPERQSEISEYAVTHTLLETVAWLRDNGVETSTGSLSTFLHWHQLRQQMGRNEIANRDRPTNRTIVQTNMKAQLPCHLSRRAFDHHSTPPSLLPMPPIPPRAIARRRRTNLLPVPQLLTVLNSP